MEGREDVVGPSPVAVGAATVILGVAASLPLAPLREGTAEAEAGEPLRVGARPVPVAAPQKLAVATLAGEPEGRRETEADALTRGEAESLATETTDAMGAPLRAPDALTKDEPVAAAVPVLRALLPVGGAVAAPVGCAVRVPLLVPDALGQGEGRGVEVEEGEPPFAPLGGPFVLVPAPLGGSVLLTAGEALRE